MSEEGIDMKEQPDASVSLTVSSTEQKPEKKTVKVIVTIDKERHDKLWDYIKKKYPSPWRKMSLTVREAIDEFLERHKDELS